MDIIKRNFFRLLRCEALGDNEALEPMSLFKWRKLIALVRFKKVDAVAANGANRYSKSQPQEMPPVIVAELNSTPEATGDTAVVSLPEAAMSNFLLNRRLNKIRDNEVHAIDTSVETLTALNIIVYNTYLLLNSGLSINAILCLGKYMRTRGDKVDFVKLSTWLASLHIQRMAQLEGSILVKFFGFEQDELPFMRKNEGKATDIMRRTLSKKSASDAEDLRFWQDKSGFVAGNTNVLRHKIWSAIRYMNYAPIEASSNFFKNLANSLAKIEE